MSLAQEDRAEGWQRDVADRNRSVASLAASVRKHSDQVTALRALVISWRDKADGCCMHQVASELRKCAGEVDAVMGE